MACGHAKFTGEVGVCLATSGPGAIHLLNGLYDAKLDHQPVVAIVGQQARAALGGDYQQEVDLLTLFKDVAHEYVQMAIVPAQIRHLVDRAVRIALDAAHRDVRDRPERPRVAEAAQEPPRTSTARSTRASATRAPRSSRTDDDLERAADDPQRRRAVAILVGAGALGAADEVARDRPTGSAPASRRRCSAEGGAAGRPPVRHRLDRPARDEAELDADARSATRC